MISAKKLLLRSILAAGVLGVPLSAGHAQAVSGAPAVDPFSAAIRLDALGGNPAAMQAGLTASVAPGSYFRIGATIAAGASSRGASERADGFGELSLDPYHVSSWEPYLGGGITVRKDAGRFGTHAYLLAVAGVNARRAGAIAPGIEVGLGGGMRVGVTLRFAGPRDSTRR